MEISFENFLMLQKTDPLLWIIDTAPLFLGVFASFGGIQLDRLADKNEELERRYTEMNKLRISADNANQAKSIFLAKISHEIRTPLNAVLGLTYLTLKEDVNLKTENNLKKIHRSGKSLLNIINDILDFSKIEAGEVSIENINVTFEELLNEAIDVANIKMKDKKDVEFVCNYDPKIPEYVYTDPYRLKQVLANLLDNAIKFTKKGEIVLKCELISASSSHAVIEFTVADTGIGISSAKLKEIFEPFKQEDDTTTRKYGGTGLGLVITRSIIELLGGEIQVESVKGQGTKFQFQIKVEIPDQSISLTNEENKKNLHGLKVLLVDDSDTSRNTLKEILESFKFKVATAGSGLEGINLYIEHENKNDPFELIIADWFMPEMDGLEMIHKLKNNGGENQSVLMVTAYGAEALREAKKANLIDSYLLKPISPSILFDSIQSVLIKQEYTGLDQSSSSSELKSFRERLSGHHVLIVEDNEINRELIVELLRDVGVSCDVSTNGVEALEQIVKNTYAAVLMDIQMPKMDGLTASREMRKIEELKELPIIAMTAHAMEGEREKSLSAGMNEHITKPIDPVVLYETLCTFLLGQNKSSIPHPTVSEVINDPSGFPKIEGLNTKSGLARAAGKHDLYARLLLGFVSKYEKSADEIAQYISGNDWKSFLEILHTIGGVAANIGADSLSKQMLSTSSQVSKNESLEGMQEEDLTSIIVSLEHIIDEIKSNVKPTVDVFQTDPNEPGINREKLTNEIEEIKTLIRESNPKAIAKLSSLLNEYTLDTATKTRLMEVYGYLEELEFDQALSVLDKVN